MNLYNCNRCLDTGIEAHPSPDDVDFEPCDCGIKREQSSDVAIAELIARADRLALDTLSFEHAKKFSV